MDVPHFKFWGRAFMFMPLHVWAEAEESALHLCSLHCTLAQPRWSPQLECVHHVVELIELYPISDEEDGEVVDDEDEEVED